MIEYKIIKEFPNYLIGNNGEVYSRYALKVKRPTSNGSRKGYLYVDLYKNNIRKKCYVHRLVAEYFLPNKDNKPYVNHKDGNPKNNNVENLEWCTPKENVEHASKIICTMKQYKEANEKRKKGVVCYLDGYKIAYFESVREAERIMGIHSSNIVACLKGRQKTAKGYTWCYVEEI